MDKKYLGYLSKHMGKKITQEQFSPSKKVNADGRRTLLIDFDGVVHNYSKGYKDGTIYDPPMEGVEDALKILKRKYKLVMCSARIGAGDKHGKKEMIEWLKKYDLLKYFSDVTNKKSPCVAFIDDSAVRHTDWKSTLQQLKKIGVL